MQLTKDHIIANKTGSIQNIVKKFQCEEIYNDLIEALENCTTLNEANAFDVDAQMNQILNSLEYAISEKLREIESYYESDALKTFQVVNNGVDTFIIINNKTIRQWLLERASALLFRTGTPADPERRQLTRPFLGTKEDGTQEILNLDLSTIDKIVEFLIQDKDTMYVNKNNALPEVKSCTTIAEVEAYDYISKLTLNVVGQMNIIV
ncbi:hypothetical protein KAR91_10600 [Candidatus Pacearchaeota archaeon]|nr:hypothetical protein [Candidatus Pacearchaeota archaeon]